MDNNLIREWFRFGDMDIATAELKMEHHPQHYEIICYHCQQSAEKYLKGYLIAQSMEQPPKIHDLIRLCELCVKYNKDFSEISRQCGSLTQYGVQPRYPDEIELDETLTNKALTFAQQIKAFAPLQELRNSLNQKENN